MTKITEAARDAFIKEIMDKILVIANEAHNSGQSKIAIDAYKFVIKTSLIRGK